jgi:hypothetical protein
MLRVTASSILTHWDTPVLPLTLFANRGPLFLLSIMIRLNKRSLSFPSPLNRLWLHYNWPSPPSAGIYHARSRPSRKIWKFYYIREAVMKLWKLAAESHGYSRRNREIYLLVICWDHLENRAQLGIVCLWCKASHWPKHSFAFCKAHTFHIFWNLP